MASRLYSYDDRVIPVAAGAGFQRGGAKKEQARETRVGGWSIRGFGSQCIQEASSACREWERCGGSCDLQQQHPVLAHCSIPVGRRQRASGGDQDHTLTQEERSLECR